MTELRPKAADGGRSAERAARSRRRRLNHQHRVLMLAVLAGLPGSVTAMIMIWSGDLTPKTQWTLTLLIVAVGGWFIAALLREVVYPLRTVSNMLVALREGDFSMRARRPRVGDALGQVMGEVNELGDMLREQRLGAMEATALLSKVMAGIDVAVFTFDVDERLQFINQRGERLLADRAERLLGRSAGELELAGCLAGDEFRILETTFPGGAGRWEVRQSDFRVGGVPHRLVLISDLTRALREQERQAWQRLIQVLRHEINNSLAPIDSLAGSLAALLIRDPRPEDWETDMREGLDVISQRSNALNRFMTAYSKLTRLPKPKIDSVDVESWVRQVAGLESRVRLTVIPGPATTIQADRDQLDQLLINLIHNAADAAVETAGEVRVGWSLSAGRARWLEVWVEDEGPGLARTDNLFVPFFTTKPEGSGIGLALSRQIAEGHGGRLTLENRRAERGCRACLCLPIRERAT